MKMHKPNWWLLYATVPLMIGVLVIESQMTYSPMMHQVLEIGIVILTFGWMMFWVHANQMEIAKEELDRELPAVWREDPLPGTRLVNGDLPFPSWNAASGDRVLAFGRHESRIRNN